jgi:hypothetical protein
MAYLSTGNTLKKRMSSVWPHVIGDELTYKHNFVQTAGNSSINEVGLVEQNPSRTVPGFAELPGLFLGFKGSFISETSLLKTKNLHKGISFLFLFQTKFEEIKHLRIFKIQN